ncbi:MAG: metalloregulator ArsR/SmtB family transcription factor [Eubacteriales bacterium]
MSNQEESTNSLSDFCECSIIHEDVVERVRKQMLPPELRAEMADFYKIMGDSTRISILHALSFSEMCVCDISMLLQMNQSAISHQLKTLRQTRLVKNRREGKVVYYSLNDNHVQQIIELVRIHLME